MSADQAMVSALLAAVSNDVSAAEFEQIADASTVDDRREAARVLALAARPTRSLLSANYADVAALGNDALKKANALFWLLDQLGPSWASRPETSLGSVLMVERAERVEYIRAELKIADVDLDGGVL